eukprot:3254345-Pleurochrysis_carterae.AAC.2
MCTCIRACFFFLCATVAAADARGHPLCLEERVDQVEEEEGGERGVVRGHERGHDESSEGECGDIERMERGRGARERRVERMVHRVHVLVQPRRVHGTVHLAATGREWG